MAGPYKLAWDKRSSLFSQFDTKKGLQKLHVRCQLFSLPMMLQQNKLERLSTLKYLQPRLKECVLSYPQIID